MCNTNELFRRLPTSFSNGVALNPDSVMIQATAGKKDEKITDWEDSDRLLQAAFQEGKWIVSQPEMYNEPPNHNRTISHSTIPGHH